MVDAEKGVVENGCPYAVTVNSQEEIATQVQFLGYWTDQANEHKRND
jgi:hypothetical protein